MKHEPVFRVNDKLEIVEVVCRECGAILWDGQGECNPPPPTLGVSVSENVGAKDRAG